MKACGPVGSVVRPLGEAAVQQARTRTPRELPRCRFHLLDRTAGIALKSVGTPHAGTRQILASDGGGCGVACSADGPRRATPNTDYAGGT